MSPTIGEFSHTKRKEAIVYFPIWHNGRCTRVVALSQNKRGTSILPTISEPISRSQREISMAMLQLEQAIILWEMQIKACQEQIQKTSSEVSPWQGRGSLKDKWQYFFKQWLSQFKSLGLWGKIKKQTLQKDVAERMASNPWVLSLPAEQKIYQISPSKWPVAQRQSHEDTKDIDALGF